MEPHSKKRKRKKKDDSPVESVGRNMAVDELPFSSKVHRAVQLWRYQMMKGRKR